MDEVGRGALAGPVSVGVVLIDATCRSAPAGVRDSKLLAPARREQLVGPVRRWALAWGVGHATPQEIDTWGIMTGLRLAGRRALAAAGVVPDLVILDGNHDWLTDPGQGVLFSLSGPPTSPAPAEGLTRAPPVPAQTLTGTGGSPVPAEGLTRAPLGIRDPSGTLDLPELEPVPPVRTIIKGDRSCSSVAAASILAKVERDAMLVERAPEFPEYGWDLNKGYAAPEHLAAIAAHGPCSWHRRSWRLPELASQALSELVQPPLPEQPVEPTVDALAADLTLAPGAGRVASVQAVADSAATRPGTGPTAGRALPPQRDGVAVLVGGGMGDDDQMEVWTR